MVAFLGQRQGSHWKLQRPGNPEHIWILDATLIQGIQCASQKTPGHVFIEARDHDRDAKVASGQLGRFALLPHLI
jgi:hypothetical protein